MLGEIALYCFVVLVVTGIFLVLFFEASGERVVYEGSYDPLVGVEMSRALASTLELSFEVRAGLLVRQIHHWAAMVFLAAIAAHVVRVFFTGAFRRPREINWLVGVSLLLLVLSAAYTGYSMLDDMLSGTGVRIFYSILLSIPFVGPHIAFLFFGGEFPGTDIIPRLFAFHVVVFPILIAGFVTMHMLILWYQKHTQFPGPGRTERNVVGERLWPKYAGKSLGLFCAVFAVLAALGGLAQINPVWIYGPYDPEAVTTGAQPDWYLMWVEGALRLFPGWEIELGWFLLPNPFFPAVLFPVVFFAVLYAWPFLEARVTGDREPHHLLESPRDRPGRTAIGTGTVTFLVVLTVAAGNDVVAIWLDAPINAVTWAFRILALAAPPLVAVGTFFLCRRLRESGAERLRDLPLD